MGRSPARFRTDHVCRPATPRGTGEQVYAGRYPGVVAGLLLADAPPVAPDPVVPPKPNGTCREQGPFARGENLERGDLVVSERQTET